MRIVIAGGGFAGCAAAMQVARMGAEVILAERTDMLCGTGAVGGIMRNNGRYTAAEEMIVMGGGQMFRLIDQHCRHKNVNFPGHRHASLFDTAVMPAVIVRALAALGVKICYMSRITGVSLRERTDPQADGRITAVKNDRGELLEGDAFIDATGTAGPLSACHQYGRGCASCIMRCASFGGRISLSSLCGIKEYAALREGKLSGQGDCPGALSGACTLMKASLSDKIREQLDLKGVAVIALPPELCEDHLKLKACQQYALPEFAHNIVLLDTGHAKLMSPYYPLSKLQAVPGLENARYEDPYAGSIGNSVRLTASVPRTDTMQVKGMENLFCAGEKSGIFVGHTEAIVTGVLAGFNAVMAARGLPLMTLPAETVCGDAIAWVNEQMACTVGRRYKYTFSGSVLFERMKRQGRYTTDTSVIRERVRRAGAENVFAMQPQL